MNWLFFQILFLTVAILLFILVLKLTPPERSRAYRAAMQEDQFVEPVNYRLSNMEFVQSGVGINDAVSINMMTEQVMKKQDNDLSSLHYRVHTSGRVSNAEAITRKVVANMVNRHNRYDVIYNVRFDFNKNPKTGKALEYDIYIPDLAFAVEYNGGFHSDPYSQYKDRIKLDNAAEKGIFLITVPESCKTEKSITEFIREELLKNTASKATMEYMQIN